MPQRDFETVGTLVRDPGRQQILHAHVCGGRHRAQPAHAGTALPAAGCPYAGAAVGAGGITHSAPATFTHSAPPPQYAVFYPSPDHDTTVTAYRFDVFAVGADPSTATPIASQDVGKPPVVNGDVTAEVTATISALGPGTYQATIAAVGAGGITQSAPATFTR